MTVIELIIIHNEVFGMSDFAKQGHKEILNLVTKS